MSRSNDPDIHLNINAGSGGRMLHQAILFTLDGNHAPMGIFSKSETVLQLDRRVVGEVNLQSDTGTGYDNVLHIPFGVKKGRKVRVSVESDKPVDVALAYGDFSSAGHKEGMTEGTLGPFDTKDFTDMALFLGVYPGDRATVSVRVWTDRK